MINGIINIYKEQGFTSNDVVCKMRGILRQKKIGHTGTLDPDAVGVLPVCLGNATRLCDLLTDHDKEYRTVMKLGVETDTQDLSGRILAESPVTCHAEDIEKAVSSYIGEYDQIPPMYSALKVNGKKLYEYARAGIEVERKARRVSIYNIVIEKIELPFVTMTVSCSKGTYIRTLCHDIGRSLGCGAAVSFLERTRVDHFFAEDAITLSRLEQLRDSGLVEQFVTSPDAVFTDLSGVVVSTAAGLSRLRNGNILFVKDFDGDPHDLTGKIRVYDNEGNFMAVYQYAEDRNAYVPWKMFLS